MTERYRDIDSLYESHTRLISAVVHVVTNIADFYIAVFVVTNVTDFLRQLVVFVMLQPWTMVVK